MNKLKLLLIILPLLFACTQEEQEVLVESISLDQSSVELEIGKTLQLTATVSPSTATVTVNAVDANDNVTIKESSASFENQQAVVKFTLQNSDGTAIVSAKPLTVKVDGTEITVTPASAVGQALRASGPVAPAISTSTAEQCMPPLRQLLTSPIPARQSALPVRIADR